MAFEQTTVERTKLHPELPEAETAQAMAPDGAIYRCEDGSRFRLRHAQPARWQPVREPRQKPATAAK